MSRRIKKPHDYAFIAVFLALFLCLAFPAQAQKYTQKPEVEIDTSVLKELSSQVGSNHASPTVKLKKPAPYALEYQQERAVLTGREIEQQSLTGQYDHIILPKTEKLQKEQPQKADALAPDDKGMILPKSKLVEMKAPLPSRKPQNIVVAKQDTITDPPIPPHRPAIQKASQSFVMQKNKEITARKTNRDAANILGDVRQTMPAAQPDAVMSEPLAQNKMVRHKERIIDAVQQIAKANKEPEIDITATKIEPAGGTAEKVNVSAYSMNSGEIVRMPFPEKESKINANIKAVINAKILPPLQSAPDKRLQIQSYASQKESRSNLNARRISLSRALAVRQHLITMGIDAQRIDIMPLGDKTDEDIEDRIDFLIFNPNAS